MSTARDKLESEFGKAALKVIAAKRMLDTIQAEHSAALRAIGREHTANERAAIKVVLAAEERYLLLEETLRMVDEEGLDPIVAKLTAKADTSAPSFAQGQVYEYGGGGRQQRYQGSDHQTRMRTRNANGLGGKR